ncbi:MAG: hypothetical protein IJX76_08465 [Clostridia bacterium]|nr:hypothetical protein [Clostridia bacterium]
METLARITETRLIPHLHPKKPEQTLPLLAALCSGGIYAAEFSMEVPFTPDAIKSGSRLFPDLVLGAGSVIRIEDAHAAIQCGARYITSPGYSPMIANLCRDHETLYLPQCTTPTELLTAKLDGLSAAGLFAPHLWGSDALVTELAGSFPGLTAIACRVPYADAGRLLSLTGIAACTLTGLPCDFPEDLAVACQSLTAMLAG